MRRFAEITFFFALLFFGLSGVMKTAYAADICPTNPSANTTRCTFNATDFIVGERTIEVETTCRVVTENLYVFVENALWDSGSVNAARLADLINAFEEQTPTDPTRGIWDIVTEGLGMPPDVFDEDQHVYLVIHDIPMTENFPVFSYIRKEDMQEDNFGDPVEGGNAHEIIFLHGENVDSRERQADLAQAFVSLVHLGYDDDEEPWVVDVLNRATAFLLGYRRNDEAIEAFANRSSSSLMGEDVEGRLVLDHGATTLFGIYLSEVFQSQDPSVIIPEFFWLWMQDDRNGLAGFENTLSMLPEDERLYNFCHYLHDWTIRNRLNRGEYGYETYDAPRFSGRFIRQHPGSLEAERLSPYAAAYVDIEVTNISPDDSFEVVYEIGDTTGVMVSTATIDASDTSSYMVEEQTVLAGQPTRFLFPGAGQSYDWIYFISTRCTSGETLTYKVKTEVVTPVEEDGDEEFIEEEPEAEIEPEVDGDEDNAPEAEIEEELAIFGDDTCPEINACYIQCADQACRETCVASGTPQAQDQWEAYIACISGHNPESKDCLTAYQKNEDREACIRRNCHAQQEVCALIEEEEEAKNSSSSGCGQTGGVISFSALLAAFALLALRRNNGGARC